MLNPLTTLSIAQLKRAAQIREQMDALTAELGRLIGGKTSKPKHGGAGRKLSAVTRARMRAAHQARWAKIRRGPKAKPAKRVKRRFSAEARARISAASKARWAKVKAAGKTRLGS